MQCLCFLSQAKTQISMGICHSDQTEHLFSLIIVFAASFRGSSYHENLPLHYAETFSAVKVENYIGKKMDIYNNNFAQNIDYGYTLDSPQRGRPYEYQQSMFWIKNM